MQMSEELLPSTLDQAQPEENPAGVRSLQE